MKVTVDYTDAPCETSVRILCSKNPDEETKKLINGLTASCPEIIGYRDEEAHRLSLSEIFYIDCVDEKTFLYLEEEVYGTRLKLYEWEERLEDTSFVRISKSALLNTDKLQSVRSLLGGKMEATMKNGEKLIINRHYMPGFRKKFGI